MAGVKIRQTLLYSVFCASSEQFDDFIPDDNREYKSKAYWDHRFAKEPSYEWLGTFEVVRPGYERSGIDFTAQNVRALVVGCGNSGFSKDLATYCPSWKITSIDYSGTVVERMRKRHPELTWLEMDMTNMKGLTDGSFDIVLDKAAMDALVADEGSSWDPSESSCKSVDDMVSSCARVLRSNGKFSIVSFQPSHFRRRHLERALGKCNSENKYPWREGIQIHPVQNPDLGTDFAIFTLTRVCESFGHL